ncbi:glycosyltransferase family 4 protein [Emticicia sp. 17c]|uniref:glycosyltransferase family 4 protein n=1 Tax=Emticicia sp. 17c TaxID=3127704 RepID=UPI00301D7762
MNILFLTIVRINTISERGIYNDLLRKFCQKGHNVYVVTPNERRYGQKTNLTTENKSHILKVKTLNLQKTNLVEKGLGTLMIEKQYMLAIKKNFGHIKFDLVLYSTPPITFTSIIRFIKKTNSAKSYLLLKDIFPQNAVDLGFFKKNSLIYKYFKRKEQQLYQFSDHIGCMSEANVEYIKTHNKTVPDHKLEVNPNSIEPVNKPAPDIAKKGSIKKKYNISADATVFLYGGNLGKPQGIGFLLDVLRKNINNKRVFFLIIGNGTEYSKLAEWFEQNNPANAILEKELPKQEYDELILIGDVGLIFLDPRFTIPNFPSRLLSYLENRMPVIAATDVHTDLGPILETNHIGKWSKSGDIQKMQECIDFFCDSATRNNYGERGYSYMLSHFHVNKSYEIIMSHFKNV